MTVDRMSHSFRSSLEGTLLRIRNEIMAALITGFTFLSVSSIFVGATGFFQTFVGYILLGGGASLQMCLAVFLITFSTYSLNKLTDMTEDSINMPERVNFIRDRKQLILFTSLGAYLVSIPLAFSVTPKALPILFVPLLANLLYSSRLLPGIPRMKDIPVMKNVFVATSWAMVCTLLPFVDISNVPRLTVLAVLYFMFVKVFINSILYDIRDVDGDRVSGIKTIPVLLGTKKTTMIQLVVNSTIILLLIFLDGPARLLVAGMMLYGYVFIIFFSLCQNPLLLDAFEDGEWMIFSVTYSLFA
jgi:4-hydroxybenzoate polyprenyltransferase